VNENYFALFGLSPAFNIDLTKLERSYRKLQSASHPDRFVSSTTAEKLHSMQAATTANEAYITLKTPALRAAYLLSLQGVNATQETNTHMPADFLASQMEWRETLEDCKLEKNLLGLKDLLHKLRSEAQSLGVELTELFDKKQDIKGATETTRKLIFIDKVYADVNKTIGVLED
jgi:molecular chaperone HscB